MKKSSARILSFVVSFVMLIGIALIPTGAVASFDSSWTAITNETELKAIENDLSGKYYLKNDITLSETWHSIGRAGKLAFTGEFDGRGHTIYGLETSDYKTKKVDSKVSYYATVGLFCINGGKISNLVLNGAKLWGGVSVGLLAGENQKDGVISNCRVVNSFVGGTYFTAISKNFKFFEIDGNQVGGIVGTNEGTIYRCSNENTDVKGWYEVGGIAGRNSGTISQCSSTGCVNAADSSDEQSTRFKWAAEGGKRYASGSTTALAYGRAGIICGYNEGSITDVYVRAAEGQKSVSIAGYNSVGGVCGKNEGKIKNAVVTNLKITLPADNAVLKYPSGTVNLSKSTTYTWSGKYFHPITASQSAGTTENCFFSEMVSGSLPTTAFEKGGRGTECTYSQMKDNAEMYSNSGWDFEDVWAIDPDVKTPSFKYIVQCEHSDTEIVGALEPTCIKQGYSGDEVCINCSKVIETGKSIPSKGHTWSDWEVVKPGSCTVNGVETRVCSTCGEKMTKIVIADGHTPAEAVKENEVAATCSKEGSYDSVVYCSACGEELSRETVSVEKTAHTPAEAVKENEVAATCNKEGSYDSVVYCSVCGAEISRDTVTVEKTAHTPAEAVKENEVAATCDKEGSYDSVVYCSACGEELSRDTVKVEKTGHTPAEAVKENEVAATCSKEGSYDSVVYCSACGEELSREAVTVEKTAHTPAEAVKENEVVASCNKEGSYDSVVYCSACGEELSREAVTVEKTAHTPAEAVKENEVAATCSKEGSYDSVVYCSVCNAELSREAVTVEKTAHTPAEAVKENEVAATCSKEGSYDSVVYCSACGEELSRETVTVEKTAHTEEIIPAVDATCTKTGLTEGKKCSVCGEVLVAQEEVPAKGHTDADGDGYCDDCGADLGGHDKPTDPSKPSDDGGICGGNFFGKLIQSIIDWFKALMKQMFGGLC